MSSARQPLNNYFMDIARLVSERSTCNRKKVGTVLVKDQRIIGTGYNGSLPGAPHCTDSICDTYNDQVHGETCLRTTHSEINSISCAAKYGISTENCTAYVTCFPCYRCLQVLIMAGINKVVYDEEYVDVRNHEIASNILFVKI